MGVRLRENAMLVVSCIIIRTFRPLKRMTRNFSVNQEDLTVTFVIRC